MKKATAILAVLLLLSAASVFAGGQKETAAEAAQPTVLTVLYYIDATQAGYAEDQAIWAKFSAENPDIKIEKEELFDQAFHDKVAAYVAAGTLPDVMYMWPSGRSTALHEKKLVKDLTPLLGKEFLSNFVPAAIDPANQNSGYLAELPQSVTYTTVMYTNTKLLKDNGLAEPRAYADLKAMVPKLRAKGVQTVLMANKDTWVMQSCLFSTVTGRLLGDAWIDSVKAGKANFSDKAFVDALGFIDTMYKDGVISRDTIQLAYGEAPALFAENKAAFQVDGDWRQGYFLTDKASGVALIDPQRQKNEFAFLNFPTIPGEKNPGVVSAIVGVGFGISASIPAGSAKEKAAVRWMKYYYSPEVQKIKLETGAFIPSRKGITSDKIEPFTQMMPQYYASINKTCYVLDGVLDVDVYTPLNNGLQEIGLGSKTPAQAAADVQKAIEAWRAKQ
jgi:raffinose/stachyose/melibiose transport system substrate-binding protein